MQSGGINFIPGGKYEKPVRRHVLSVWKTCLFEKCPWHTCGNHCICILMHLLLLLLQ